MNVDDTHLMAYVDGNLSETHRMEVDTAVNESPELARRIADMRASMLPYARAFDRQALPRVPPGVIMCVEALACIDAKAPAPRSGAARLWLATAFIAGAFFCGTTLKLMSSDLGISLSSSGASAWVQAVASYQDLYSRETLVNVTEDPKLTEKVVHSMRQTDGLAVRIPDLRDVGLTFKRIQRLQFDGKPLAQIVYLPEHGEPIALCVINDARPAEAMHVQQHGDMKAVVWRQDRLNYVLLGKDRADLDSLGRRISSGNSAVLYGSASPGLALDNTAARGAG